MSGVLIRLLMPGPGRRIRDPSSTLQPRSIQTEHRIPHLNECQDTPRDAEHTLYSTRLGERTREPPDWTRDGIYRPERTSRAGVGSRDEGCGGGLVRGSSGLFAVGWTRSLGLLGLLVVGAVRTTCCVVRCDRSIENGTSHRPYRLTVRETHVYRLVTISFQCTAWVWRLIGIGPVVAYRGGVGRAVRLKSVSGDRLIPYWVRLVVRGTVGSGCEKGLRSTGCARSWCMVQERGGVGMMAGGMWLSTWRKYSGDFSVVGA